MRKRFPQTLQRFESPSGVRDEMVIVASTHQKSSSLGDGRRAGEHCTVNEANEPN
jgi:hypothetical protein